MCIEKFVSENSIDCSKNLIDEGMLEQAEQTVGVRFGKELTKYLLNYGYLGYEYVELYGMNSLQGLKSDLVEQTLYLHKYHPATVPFVALENQSEGDYYLVDGEDAVYAFESSSKKLKNTNLSLFEYIVKRFKTVKGQSPADTH